MGNLCLHTLDFEMTWLGLGNVIPWGLKLQEISCGDLIFRVVSSFMLPMLRERVGVAGELGASFFLEKVRNSWLV